LESGPEVGVGTGVGAGVVGVVGVVLVAAFNAELEVATVAPADGASTIFVPGLLLLLPQAARPTAASASNGALESRLIMGRGAG
jgi:hypothetical protein